MTATPLTRDGSLEALVAQVVDEFLERQRRGERPDPAEYAARHPQAAAVLREVLAALRVVGLSSAAGLAAAGGAYADDGAPAGTLGDFRIVREVGRGGMGVVYEAEQLSLGRRVALKVLPFAGALDPRHLQRFRNEAQAAAGLHHQHIVPVYFVGNERGVHFYAMQFIDGQTLAAVVAELRDQDRPSEALSEGTGSLLTARGPAAAAHDPGETAARAELPTERSVKSAAYVRAAAELGVQAAEALEYAHQLGVVHRDVKPANLLLDGRGHLWVTDFGLAQVQRDTKLTMTGDVVGTLRYMSPEQALGRHGEVDPRTDVYALGVTLYELLTLRPAFDGRDREALLRQVERDEPVPPRRLNPAVPADLETVVLKAMCKEREGRYATARELADDLGRFLEDQPIRAKRPTPWQRLTKWARRYRPVVVSLAGAAAALLVAVAVTATVAAVRVAREQRHTQAARDDFQRLAAELALDKGQLLGEERGDANLALLWTARSLRLAPAEAVALQAVIRANLGAWWDRVHPLRAILPHGSEVGAVAFAADGGILTASGRRSRTVAVWRWDAATGQRSALLSYTHKGETVPTAVGPRAPLSRVLLFSPDGSLLLIGFEDGVVRLVRVAGGEVLWEHRLHEITAAAFSPDGKKVLIGYASSNEIAKWSRPGWARLWDAVTGQPLGPPLEHPRLVWAAAFSPDGQTFVTECGTWLDKGEKGLARFWDLDGSETRAPLEHPCMATAVAFSPDGKHLLTANGDLAARLWDLATDTCDLSLLHEGPVRNAAFSPDGRTLLTGSYDGTARLWDRTGRPLSPPLWHQSLVQCGAFRPDGKSFLTGSQDGAARLWELAANSPAGPSLPHEERFCLLALSPDRRTYLAQDADQMVRLRSAATGTPLREPLRPGGLVLASAFSPDGKRAVTVREDNAVRLWDLAAGQAIKDLPHPREVYAAAFSPDGKTFLTGTWNHARLWDAVTGDQIRLLKHEARGPVFTVTYGPDGQTALTGAADSTARLWDLATGQQAGEPVAHYTSVFAAALGPDGQTILIGGTDHSARLWDVASRQPLGPPLAHQGAVLAADFSPDGRTVLTGSRDRTARLWDVATGKPLGPSFRHAAPVHRVAFWQDGKTVLTANASADPRLLTRGDEALARFWQAPVAMTGDPERLELWAQVVTGMDLGADGGVRVLDATTLRQRRERLTELGPPPPAAHKGP